MNKNNNPNKTPSKPKWVFYLSLIAVSALLVWLLWYFLSPKEQEISIGKFIEFLNEAQQSNNDNTYFIDLNIDKQNGKIFFSMIEKGISKKYFLGATGSFMDSLNEFMNSKYFGMDSNALKFANQYGIKIPAGEIKADFPIIFFQYESNGKILGSLNGVRVKYIVEQSIWLRILLTLGPTILLLLFIIFIFRLQMKSGDGIFNPGKNQAQRIISDKKFKDVAGNEEVKEEVKELVDYLKDPRKYSAAGARIPKGILLGGPPGTGKTLIAKATAGEASVPFFFISGSNFVEMYVGVGAKRVRELFKEARKEAPAIIFIDEIDAVGRSRGAGIGGGNDEREQTLNQLLVEMDGMANNSGILIMAATNRTDVLDPALLRPGRFDRTITVNLPDIKEREAILKLHAKGKRIDSDVTFKNLAKRTPGYSGAQLENVINEAALLSVRENTGVITKNQIDEAIDRVMAGPAKKSRTISAEELEMVAYHEAGHAVVGIKVPGGNKVQKITIIPRGQAGGYNLMLPEKEKFNQSKIELEAMIKSYMGGRAAEEIIYGKERISTGAADDIQRATSIARRMVTEWGMSSLGPVQYEEPEGSVFLGRDYTKSKVSDALSQEIDNEIRKIITEAQKDAIKIIKENKKLLELIKTLLIERETIVAEEIEYINTHMKLPPKEENNQIITKTNINIDQVVDDLEIKKKNKAKEKQTKTITTPFEEK